MGLFECDATDLGLVGISPAGGGVSCWGSGVCESAVVLEASDGY